MQQPADESRAETSLAKQTVRGASWTYASTLITASLQVLVTAVLARLLTPSDFGLVTMGLLVLNFSQFFAQLGIVQAIVQRRELTSDNVRAGFWMSITVGSLFAALVWLCAPLGAALFGAHQLTPVLRFMGLSFFFTGLAATGSALLLREMKFRSIAMIEVASYVVGYASVGVTSALLGAGVWSLVAANLAQSIVACCGYNLLARPPVTPLAKWSPYRDLLGFGSTLSVIQFVEFVVGNLDNMTVGRVAGSAALGFYSRALNLTSLPLYYMSNSLSRVLFPSFSRAQDDSARVRRAYISVMTLVAAVGPPVALGLSGSARELVQVLLGSKWGPSVPVVRVAGIAAAAITLSRFGVILLQATGHLKERLLIRIGQLILFALALDLLHGYGLVGYASAFAVSEVVFHIALATRLSSRYRIGAQATLRAYLPGIVGGVSIWVFAYVESRVGRLAGVPAPGILIVQVITGLGVLSWVVLRAGKRQVLRVLQDYAGVSSRYPAMSRLLRRFAA